MAPEDKNQKDRLWNGAYDKAPTKEVDQFIIDPDQIKLDGVLGPYDLIQNEAHVLMLIKQQIITQEEGKKLLLALRKLGKGFMIDSKLGLHMTIEKLVTQEAGEVGKKIHTARSRNDQIITITRMYMREHIVAFFSDLIELINTCIEFAEKHTETVMVGFTHSVPAQPMTLGYWIMGLVSALTRDLKRLINTYEILDSSPLGCAASFGTTWNIDREYTAKLLGFSNIDQNCLDGINRRGEDEAAILQVVSHLMSHCSKIAQDIILWNSIGLIIIREEMTHGSSIMPQKKNPDVPELIRANSSILMDFSNQCLRVISQTPSGYNRDSRETKRLVIQGLTLAGRNIFMLNKFIPNIETTNKISEMISQSNCIATDLVEEMSQKQDIPFRTAHQIIGEKIGKGEQLEGNALDYLKKKNHIGSPNPSEVEKQILFFKEKVQDLKSWAEERQKQLQLSELEKLVKKVINSEN
ncbi:MAG: argininosuccinate lyase [Candidatus Ranarchaeia archaeon]